MNRLSSRVSVVGIDGSGKSLTVQQAASHLSETYRTTPIRVVDSTGITHLRGGETTRVQFEHMDRLKASAGIGRLATLAHTGGFTLARRAAETLSCHRAGLTIGVRDPYRLDLATYLPTYTETARSMSPEKRLAIFHRLTTAAHPLLVAQLDVDPRLAYSIAESRGTLDSHETEADMVQAAEDMAAVTSAYETHYGVNTVKIKGLQHDTVSMLAEQLEPHVAGYNT